MESEPRPPVDEGAADPAGVMTRQDFAVVLTVLRERAGLTVRQVAAAAGLPSSTVGGYFGGRHLPPVSPPSVLSDLLRACGVADPPTVEAWRTALLRVRRAPGPRRTGDPVPYRGLAAFQPEDAGWFFGREELTRQLVGRLANRYADGNGLLVVVGQSGSGKSSLLRAGLVPALRSGGLGVSGSEGWPVRLFTPGLQPHRRLRDELAAAGEHEAGLIVVVDQAEELFLAGRAAAGEFVEELSRLATRDGRVGPALVVLGLRADFYPHALAYPALAAALQEAQVVVGPMTAAQLRSVIVEPARLARADVDDGLVEVLLRDLAPTTAGGHSHADHPAGALPLLSHALMVTWERGRARRLSLANYHHSGGLRGAVAQTAELVYGTLDGADQEAARQLFLRLVRVSPEGADTARRVPRQELVAGGAGTAARAAVLERFIASRLLTADTGGVQLSHEALLHAWPRLRGWIDADRAGLVTGQQLIDAAQAWEREGRDPAALYRGSRLATAREWARGRPNHSASVGAFLGASTGRERRGLHRLYATITALAALLAVAVTTGAVAVQQRGLAVAQEEGAMAERDRAVSRLVAGRADRLRDQDVALAAQLSLIAYRISPTTEALAGLIDSSATHTVTRLLGSTGVMQSVALSPDRRTLAAGTADRTVLLWDLTDPSRPTRREPALTGPEDVVYSVAFSPDGRTLVAGSGDHLVYRWDLTDPGRPAPLLPALAGAEGVVYSVAVSPDGRTLVAGSSDALVHRWDVAEPRLPTRLEPLAGAGSFVQAVTFSPGGGLLAAGSEDATVRLWDVRDRAAPVALGPPLAGPERTVFSVAFSPDETTLAAGTRDGTVHLWDLTEPQRPAPLDSPLTGASGWVQALAFSPDGDTLAASGTGQVRLWDWRSRRITAVLPHSGPVTSVTYGGDGRLVSGSADGVARMWRLRGPALRGDGVPVNSVRFSPAGDMVAVASGETRLWSVDGRLPVGPPIVNPAGFSGTATFLPDGEAVVISDSSGGLLTWSLADPGRPVPLEPAIEAHSMLIQTAALSPDAHTLATGGDDNLVRLWDVSDPGRPVRLAELKAFDKLVYSVAFDPVGKLLAAASVDNTVRIWDVRDPARPVELTGPLTSSDHYALAVAFHPDDPILAVGSADKNVYLWDIGDPRRPVRIGPPLVGPENYVYALAYNPDGGLLAAANTDGSLWLWDVADPHAPAVRATLTAGSGPLYTVAFHPVRPMLAAGGGDSTVWLWNTDVHQIARDICRTAGDPLTVPEWEKYVPDLPYRPPC
jgi:WD40 repeat protein